MARILVTPRSLTSSPPPELDRLRAAGHELVFSRPGIMPDEAELLALVPGADCWLAGVEPVSASVIAAAGRLRVISRNGTGVDNLPLPLLAERGIEVMRASAANATGVAELAIGLMLSACRHLPAVSHGVREGAWPRPKGREIEDATVGVVGTGAVGRRVVRILAGLGAKVLAFDPFRPDLGPLAEHVTYVEVAELLARSEIVTLHCPMPENGRPLLDAAALAGMRPDAILINTARAGLVAEDALLEALDANRLATYATDVFAVEPPHPGGLAAHSRVIATSHIGGLTEASVRRATAIAVENLLLHLGDQGRAAA